MTFSIKRFHQNRSFYQTFDVEPKQTVLNALMRIKFTQDASLSYRCGCKTGICGSCAIRVNGVEKLACKTYINKNGIVEPLRNANIIKDLVVDLEYEEKLIQKSKSYLKEYSFEEITAKDEKSIDRQSNCILCQSCYSSCPVYEVNHEFLGPYALTRALRYANDKKNKEPLAILQSIQDNGIWDCTLCGNCTMVCPQYIDPKTDILNLRMHSVQKGFEDKSMAAFTVGFDSDFGFNPNGF